ncbi:hypothetical protein RHMOL_Rhmol08G0165500 [Rhododendron molle]|uniref:Uncharacterized protein n=1 Tax=Rhododendron molle TaxID=49168 RepID=A0ACC0MPB2_RHOML|nr:hypothetical protein RHMOL_Rhmol08G0165500 [Rhododendron molle]
MKPKLGAGVGLNRGVGCILMVCARSFLIIKFGVELKDRGSGPINKTEARSRLIAGLTCE